MSTERQQRLCIWAGVMFFPLFAIGLGAVAGWIPPPSPNDTAEATRQMFIDDRDRIRIGVWILTAVAPLLLMYIAALTHQIRRIAGRSSPLANAQLAAGALLAIEFIFPQMIWQGAAYRPEEHSTETIQTLMDVGWLMYIGVVGTAVLQMLILALVILTDRSDDPLLPRWLGYVNIWSALGITSGSLCVFTTTGPFAWNGILAWWVLLVAFFVWLVGMTWGMLQASRRVEDIEM